MLKIAVLYPDLLGTYGDAGNGLVVAQRAERRGIDVSLTMVEMTDQIPEADLYLLGGGEDGPQRLACELLAGQEFARRVADGAYVVAVCAGLQLLGQSFSIEGDAVVPGLGIVDVTTRRGSSRSVGDLLVSVGDHLLVGFENHGGVTMLGEGVEPLGALRLGRGNDGSVDGYCVDRIWATYAHGPVMALNPWFADTVLAAVLARPLEPLVTMADRLYAERCQTLLRG